MEVQFYHIDIRLKYNVCILKMKLVYTCINAPFVEKNIEHHTETVDFYQTYRNKL